MKFDKQTNERLYQTVRNFNAKIRYSKTKTRGRGMLPRPISAKEIKDKYSDKSKAEFEKQLRIYQEFSKRNALDLAGSNRLSNWEQGYFEQNMAKTKKFYDDEIADLERITAGQPEYHQRLHNRLQTLKRQREALNRPLTELTEDQIKGFRGYFNYAERSEIIKQKGFRLYLSQLDRTMDNLGYSKKERNELLDKFNVLSENEFTEMVRNEDLIDAVYDLIDSPKGRGKYELMADQQAAEALVENIKGRADELIAKYKTSK